MSTERPKGDGDHPSPASGINPSLKRGTDSTFTEDQHGSDPMGTVSVKKRGPEVWPIIWAAVGIVLVLLTVWFVV